MTVDGAGNVLSVSVQEPRFTPGEKALLLLSWHEDHVPRGRHGIPLHEATAAENQFQFEVPEPVMDHAQRALNDAKARWEKLHGDKAGADAVVWRVQYREKPR